MKQTMKNRLIAQGATTWAKNGSERLYINVAGEKLLGLTYTTYKNGGISSAKLNGETISNASAGNFLTVVSETYYDMATGELVIAKPRFVKEYDFTKIKEMIEEAIAKMAADIEAEAAKAAAEQIIAEKPEGAARVTVNRFDDDDDDDESAEQWAVWQGEWIDNDTPDWYGDHDEAWEAWHTLAIGLIDGESVYMQRFDENGNVKEDFAHELRREDGDIHEYYGDARLWM